MKKIMLFVIHRTKIGPQITEENLYFRNRKICDTLENTQVMLPPGEHPLGIRKMYLTHGNGAYRLKKPDIIVGVYRCHGLLIHSRRTYMKHFERIRKSIRSKHQVSLVIKE